MGSSANRLRKKWQDYSGTNALKSEEVFFNTLKVILEDTEYQIISKPKEFSNIIR